VVDAVGIVESNFYIKKGKQVAGSTIIPIRTIETALGVSLLTS